MTGGLVVRALQKAIGRTVILRGIDLDIADGEIVSMLGPSGCGKTTLLRLIAGFDGADAGSIALDSRPIADAAVCLAPHLRGIGFVPQEGVLFPNLSVADNIAFGLDRAGRPARVEALLDTIGLSGYGRRMPHELSGGQQQRVALARALAPHPGLLLLDEPFNALDPHLRRTLCADVRRILKGNGITAILVTHDRDEAFAMADRVAIMRGGRIVQVGTPLKVYAEPVDLDTAVQGGAIVCLPGQADGPQVATALGMLTIGNPGALGDGAVTVMLRPEQIVPGEPAERGRRALVRERTFLGPMVWLDLRLEGTDPRAEIRACWPSNLADGAAGETITVAVRGPVRVFPSV